MMNETRIRDEMVRSQWWWHKTRRAELHLTFGGRLGTGDDASLAKLVFEGEFERSAWMYEAHRRFHRPELGLYPELSLDQMHALAREFPSNWTGFETSISLDDLSKGVEHAHGWTPFAIRSYNLHASTKRLVKSFQQYIAHERERQGISEPNRPGRRQGTWADLEAFDLGERIGGYLAGNDGARSQVSKARQKAPASLKSLRL